MNDPSGFRALLRVWRERRGLSQIELADLSRTSQRHVSFLESGRSAPGRDTVLKLAAALDLPLRQQNALLLAAGFAPLWREGELSLPEFVQIEAALRFMLDQQEPFAAVVVDRRWNILKANKGAARLVAFLSDPGDSAKPSADPVNLADALVAPGGMRRHLVNWPEVAVYFLRGVQSDAIIDGSAETAALLSRLLSYPGVPDPAQTPAVDAVHGPVLTMHFRRGEVSLRLFTAIATLGTPLDVTLQEIRIESFFPADEATAAWFRQSAG